MTPALSERLARILLAVLSQISPYHTRLRKRNWITIPPAFGPTAIPAWPAIRIDHSVVAPGAPFRCLDVPLDFRLDGRVQMHGYLNPSH
jgi:hypothetical protein